MFLQGIEEAAAVYGLMAMGGAHIEHEGGPHTVVLVGTAPEFWTHFSTSTVFLDGLPDPVDRWSQEILPKLRTATGACAIVYPFGGPPYAPFLAWAKQTGEAFDSPVGMLVHYRAGLLISYRGALLFDGYRDLPAEQPANPCDSCADRPCVNACPVNALSDQHFYDVPTCKTHIATKAGTGCMEQGCATRLACPVSRSFGRPIAQTALHMRAFKGA